LPIGVEVDVGLGHIDVRQFEVVTGGEVELFVDALDRLAQFFKLDRCFLANLFEAFGVDLFRDRFLRLGVPFRLGFGDAAVQGRIDVRLEGL
jgi:hypothetical protein